MSNYMGYPFLQYELETPLINAAGLVNGSEEAGIIRDVETLAATSIGAITVGSLTIPRRLGNAAEFGEPTYHYDFETETMTNALGLPNVGIDAAEELVEEIHEAANGKPVIFSVSPVNAEEGLGSSVDQSIELIGRMLAAGAKIVELNVSCPNVITESGDRKPIMGHDVSTMKQLVHEVSMQLDVLDDTARYVGVKLPPYISLEQMRAVPKIARHINHSDFDYVVTSNTIPGGKPTDENGNPILRVPGGTGGMSGPATAMQGRFQLAMWGSCLTHEKQLVSALGVYDGKEMAVREALGAVASEMNTRLWNSTNWQATIAEVLAEYASAQQD